MIFNEADNEHFWSARDCFLPPIPEVNESVELVSLAADAILNGNLNLAGELMIQADMPELCQYYQLIAGSTSQEIHRFREIPNSPKVTNNKIKERMPSSLIEHEIYCRDGWRCRFCGTRVISKKAVHVLRRKLPLEARWGRGNADKHCALLVLSSSLDHILPYSRRGNNEPDNFVTACGPCQFGRNQWTLEEVGFTDPRSRPPIVDEWDGLVRIC